MSVTMSDANLLLDYSHYVEIVDQEECACFSRHAMGLVEAAENIGAVVQGPIRFFPGDLGQQIVEYERERKAVFGKVEYYRKCPYCQVPLVTAHEAHRGFGDHFGRIFVSICPSCGWWESSDECSLEQDDKEWYRSREIRRRSLLREYSIGGSEIPLDLLHRHLAKHPNAIYSISPRKLEQLVCRIFSEFMSCEAVHLGAPGDGGIDLVLIRGEHEYVVQVKRRASPNSAEAVSGIREFIGAMLLGGKLRGIFVTTAPKFSQASKAAVEVAHERQLVESIDLVDGKRLIDVCKLTSSSVLPPWQRFALNPTDPVPSFPDQVFFAFPVRQQ